MNLQKNHSAITILTVLALVAGIAIRLIHLFGSGGFWIDEIWSMICAAPQYNTWQVVRHSAYDAHPPVFDVLLHSWLKITSYTDFNARLMVFLFALLSLYISWYVSLKITESRTGAKVMLALVSLSFFHIQYSDEVRFYILFYLLSCVLLLQFWCIITTNLARNYLFYILTGILVIYTHYYGAILLFGYGVIITLLRVLGQVNNKVFLRFLLSSVVILIAFSPWIKYMFGGQTFTWIEKPGPGIFFSYLYAFTGKNPVEFALYASALVVGLFGFSRHTKLYVTLYGVFFISFIIAVIVSLAINPIMHTRYLIGTLPALFMLTIVVFKDVANKRRRLVFALALVVGATMLMNVAFVNKDFKEGKEPWKQIAQRYSTFKGNDKLPVVTEENMYLDYYLKVYKSGVSVPVTEINRYSEFWYLDHPYSTISRPLVTRDYNVLQEYTFSHGFVLKKVSRKPVVK